MKRDSIKWAIHQATGLPVFIENAENGLSCNCKCAGCGKVMIAEQGETKKRAWNFRHYEASDCSGGFETAIHKAAKEIILGASEIMLPAGKLAYTNPRKEYIIGEFRTDVSVTSPEYEVHFEIEVTNPVDQVKSNFYRANKHKSVKIDLTFVSIDISPDDLKKLILDSTEGKTNIYWNDEQSAKDNSCSGIGWLLFAVAAFLGLRWLFKKRK